jgi:hypothetical protein
VRIQYDQLSAAKVSNPEFRGKRGNSPDISKGIFQSGMWEFDPFVVSQAVLFSENFLPSMRKARQLKAFLIEDSLQSHMFEIFGPRTPESLHPNSRKLPFSGDLRWRP